MTQTCFDSLFSCFNFKRKNIYEADEESITGPAPKILEVDLLKEQNGQDHNTSEFNNREGIVIRRGRPFTIRLTCDGRIRSTDELTLHLKLEGPRNVNLVVKDVVTESTDKWSLEKMDTRNSIIELDINSPASSDIGIFTLHSASLTRDDHTVSSDLNEKIVVLYNAWCKDDPVFLHLEKERQEYVLNDTGFIWYGTHNNQGKMPWFYGQFEKPALDCALHLLLTSRLSSKKWGNPVEASRTLSALCNANDDNGVLVGNWSGDYSDGFEPTSWKGSVRIIRQFMLKKNPVSFGQCWVFSGVFTTLMRSLGIPTRTVTNFRSAHDTDVNLTIDNYFDENMDPVDHLDSDTIWNFHVWNESWMRRDDLPPGYGGWQALDATPQEKSKGKFQTGPASVQAIKHGKIDLPYDAKFVYAEVNACVKHWEIDRKGNKLRELYSDPKDVGRFISTKAVGSDNRLDITDQYKFKEGSVEEETAFREARKFVNLSETERRATSAIAEDVVFNMIMPPRVMIGHDVEVILSISNKSGENRQLKVTMFANLIRYTGFPLSELRKVKSDIEMKQKSSTEVRIKVEANDYMNLLKEDAGIKFSSLASVFETKQTFAAQKDFSFDKPQITINTQQPLHVGRQATIQVQVQNPLDIDLQDCVLRLEGPGIDKEVTKRIGRIKKSQNIQTSIRVSPRRLGRRKYIASFSSKSLHNVSGQLLVRIDP